MNRAQSNEDLHNAEFIAHAREDIPALLQHIETLESQLRATEQGVAPRQADACG